KSRLGQELNFDFQVESKAQDELVLQRIELRVLDRSGRLEYARFIDSGGFSPAILTIPNRDLKAGEPILVFNPFHTLPPDLDLASLKYRFEFSSDDKKL